VVGGGLRDEEDDVAVSRTTVDGEFEVAVRFSATVVWWPREDRGSCS
jgi:hypothetical protein